MKKIVLVCFMFAVAMHTFSQQNISIGILSDFDKSDPRSQLLNQAIFNEIQRVTGTGYNIILNDQHILNSWWDVQKASENYKSLSSETDLILLIGSVSIKGCLQNQPFTIPTIGLGVFDTALQNIPYTAQESSGLNNFSYVLTSQDLKEELTGFKQMVDFRNLALIYDERTNKVFNQEVGEKKIKELEDLFHIDITFVPLESGDNEIRLNQIPDNVDAAYLAVPFELTPDDAQGIMDILNDKKIPTLSMNQEYVHQGALFSFSKDNGLEYIIKKIAVMADAAITGENLGEANVNIHKKRELYVNMSTANKIGYMPDFQTLFSANIIDDELQGAKIYGIQDIIKLALEQNLDIRISDMDIELSENDIEYAKSNFLPDVDASASGVLIDENSASPLVGQAEQTIKASGKLQQLIYSESAIANIKIQKYLLEAQKYATEQEILTQILNCYKAYFSILQVKTNISIQKENLSALKTNLEMAKVRAKIGAQNNADVYRWESELANAKQSLIEANTNLMISKFQLGNLLNNQLEDNFDIKDVSLDDEIFSFFTTSKLAEFINSPIKLVTLSEFLIQEARINYPAKKQLLSNLQAVDRQAIMNKRMFYTPTVAITGQIDETLYRGGVGSDPITGLEDMGIAGEFNNTTWNTALSVSIPIIDGKRRKLDVQTTNIQRDQLNVQIRKLDQDLSLQVKANTLQVMASGTKINLSKVSAENTLSSFNLVQENYKQGTVSITQLIDVQKAAFNARQAYALSIYEYLVNFLSLENSVGFYSMLSSADEQNAFKERFLQFISAENTNDN